MTNVLDLQDRVIRKAHQDPNFRRLLVDDPDRAIQEELGITVPSGIKIKVLENTADAVHLVLPIIEGPDGGTGPKGVTWSSESNGCHC